jgi:integrase
MLPGVHRVRGKLAGGRLVVYWYAHRGGPQILHVVAKTEAELARLVAQAAPEAAIAFRDLTRPQASTAFLSGLITAYLESGVLTGLADRTQRDIRKALDVVRRDLGEMEVKALDASGARKVLMAWRDRYKATPCTADERMEGLARVITWAKARDELKTNALEDWPRLYKVNRAEAIWTKLDLIKLLQGADKSFRQAVLFAALSGIRLGDLVGITWANVGAEAITYRPSKGKRHSRVCVIPITPKLAAILKQIGPKDVGVVLTHSRGKPWTGWGLQTAMQRAKTTRGIKGLRFHDLRGTAATNFIRAGLPPADVATVMGWEPQRIQALANYVTADAVAAGMLERLRKNKSGARL